MYLFTDKLIKIWFVEDLELKKFTKNDDQTKAESAPPIPSGTLSAT